MRGLDHVRTTNQHASKDARQTSQQWEQETAIQPRLNTIIMVRSVQDRTIQQAYGGMMFQYLDSNTDTWYYWPLGDRFPNWPSVTQWRVLSAGKVICGGTFDECVDYLKGM